MDLDELAWWVGEAAEFSGRQREQQAETQALLTAQMFGGASG